MTFQRRQIEQDEFENNFRLKFDFEIKFEIYFAAEYYVFLKSKMMTSHAESVEKNELHRSEAKTH